MAAKPKKTSERFRIDPKLTMGAVTIGVNQLDKMARFYQRLIGLSILSSSKSRVELGIGNTPMVILEEKPEAKGYARVTGLFHMAILLPSRGDLGHWLKHLTANQYPLDGAGDHLVSEALYLSDPEGNGIEIYCDRPRESWQHDKNGIKMATLPVDLESLQADAPAEEFKVLPGKTSMGHIHLKVDDVEKAMGFYRDLLGFDLMATWMGAAFLSAGGYHHHIGTNTWFSRGAPPPPSGAAGLLAYRIIFSTAEERTKIINRLDAQSYPIERVESDPSLRDPAGNGIILQVRES